MIKVTKDIFLCERTGCSFPTEAKARASENRFTKKQIAELKRRIKAGKYWLPKVGELIYVRTMMSCDHGWDDVRGGLAAVKQITFGMSGGDPKTPFIDIVQHDRGYNWRMLFDEQAELQKRHKLEAARPDPDYGPGGNQYDPHEWH